MHVQRIMCPVDFSESSLAAFDAAASLARQFEAQLLVLHVDEHSSPTADGVPDHPAFASAWGRLFEQSSPSVNGIRLERHVTQGKPCDEIPRFAQSHDVDLVVMAHHTTQERVQCQSDGVCDSTSRQCGCPVMTVQHAAAHPPWVRVDGDGWSPL